MKAKLIAVIILTNVISAGILSADSHEEVLSDEEEVLQVTMDWNRSANRGEWKEFYSYFARGCSEFWKTGMIRTQFNGEDPYTNKIKNSIDWTNNGGKRQINLRHPEATVYGNVAVVTTYRHGSFRRNEEEERNYVWDKVTIVWNKTDDGWKIVHSHYSDLKAQGE